MNTLTDAFTPASRSAAAHAGGTPRRIAFIQSCWHRDIVDICRESFLAHSVTLSTALGTAADTIDCFEVPGAFEIPLYAKLLAQQGKYAAIVTAGLVVDGGIYRHEFVAHAVIDALMRVQLDTLTPVFSGVLTPHHFHGSEEHIAFFREHMKVKGTELAQACANHLTALAALGVPGTLSQQDARTA